MKWRVRLTAEAHEQVRRLPPATKRAMRAALEALARDGLSADGVDVRRLSTGPERVLYRLRVRGWRVALRPEGKTLVVIRVFHRSEGYGWMERLQ